MLAGALVAMLTTDAATHNVLMLLLLLACSQHPGLGSSSQQHSNYHYHGRFSRAAVGMEWVWRDCDESPWVCTGNSVEIFGWM